VSQRVAFRRSYVIVFRRHISSARLSTAHVTNPAPVAGRRLSPCPHLVASQGRCIRKAGLRIRSVLHYHRSLSRPMTQANIRRNRQIRQGLFCHPEGFIHRRPQGVGMTGVVRWIRRWTGGAVEICGQFFRASRRNGGSSWRRTGGSGHIAGTAASASARRSAGSAAPSPPARPAR
jgi:hypothetical protein